MRKIIILLLVLSIISSLFGGCSNKNDAFSISEWDLQMIGYFNDWDKNVPTGNYIVGFIDVDSTVKADDGTSDVKHEELLKSVVRRISTKCKTKTVILNRNPSLENFMSTLSEMIDSGIKVINISLGTTNKFQFSDEIFRKIKENGVIVVCAAGNNTEGLMYPAKSKGTVSVLACDIYGQCNKNFDKTIKKSYTMPGLHINLLNNYYSGTSLSAVYFSVVSAAYFAVNPRLTTEEVLFDLKDACDYESENSYGIVQIEKLFS